MAQNRLPTDVVPRNYKLEVKPDLKAFAFEGSLEITAKVVNPTRRVVLNCAEIKILSVRCSQGLDQQNSEDAIVTFDKEAETVTLEYPSELSKGEVVIAIQYTGILNDQMRGFYRSKYIHPDHPDEERFAAVTQFESTDARRALPCWDEPAHKATFDVSLVVPSDRVALSNMNEISSEEIEEGLKRVKFAKTPMMSTYLLAFIVGEFDYVEETDANGVLVRVYTPVGKAEHGRFALDIAVKTLLFYKDYFNVAYPLPKMDLVAIPDMSAVAMENWGLVPYRENCVLVDPFNTTEVSKLQVALLIAHELAHQWFGNLVTMEWWTHVWLNEGFATWIQYLFVDHVYPDYELWNIFLNQRCSKAMNVDALASSHPIEFPVGSPAEAEAMFDVITYGKGASIIRMVCDWIGREAFRKGMNNYLTKFAYGNASTEDLWASLGEASGKPVAMVMSTWAKQMGYPVLYAEGKQENNKMVLTISQKKFCGDGNIGGFESVQWQIPVTVATNKSAKVMTFVLDKQSTSITLVDMGPNDWVLVNPGRVGFYRVSYSSNLLTLLMRALRDGALCSIDRLVLLSDAFTLARAGVGSMVDVLRLFASYKNETSYTVWESLVSNLSALDRLLQHTDFYESFKKFAVKLFGPVVVRLGWDEMNTESPMKTMMRSLVIGQHGYYGNPDTIAEAKRRFQDHVEGRSILPAYLEETVFTMALANGDDSVFEQLIKLHDSAQSHEEKVRIYRCLGAGKTEKLTNQCIKFAISDSVKSQDLGILLDSARQPSPLSRTMVWKFVKNQSAIFMERYQDSYILSKIIDKLTEGLATEEEAWDVEKFFTENPVFTAKEVIKQTCETARVNAKWMQRDAQAMKEWLGTQ